MLDCILGQSDFPQTAEMDRHVNFVRVVESRLKSVYGKRFEEAFAARVRYLTPRTKPSSQPVY